MNALKRLALVLLAAALWPHSAQAQGAPFVCNDDLYQVRSGGTPGVTALLRFPQAVLGSGGTASNVWGATNSPPLNAIGSRQQDGFIYGLVQGTQLPQLYRLGQSTLVPVGTIVTQGAQTPTLTASFNPTAGTFDTQGRFYFAGQTGNTITPSAIYRVDNFTTDVDPGTAGVQLGVAAIYPLSASLPNIGDFAFGADGNLYAATGTTLVQILLPATPGTATVTTRTVSAVGTIGSAFFSNAGVLYVYDNNGAQLRSITFDFGAGFGTGAVTVGNPVTINGAPPLPSNTGASDGSSCLLPNTDLSAAVTLPTVLAPGSTVTGTLVCTNNGPSAAATVTCTASTSTAGATLTVGTCTPATPVAALRAIAGQNSITCPLTLLVPGTPGGTNTTPTQVSVTGVVTTVTPEVNTANNTATVTPDLIDALDEPAGTPVDGAAGGVGVANVLLNDTLGAAVATLASVQLTQVSTTNPNVALNVANGAINVAPGTPAGTYTVVYQICSTALPAVCDTAQASIVVNANVDYGDAPDTGAGTGIGNYNTVSTDGGASHFVAAVPTVYLGVTAPDGDSGALQNATATADDATGTDDEDDVPGFAGSFPKGQTYAIPITVAGNGFLNAWVDWNRDGDFLDAGEQIATGVARTPGTANLSVTVPATAAGGATYARFRYSSTQTLGPTGTASDGEVEDYAITLLQTANLTLTKTNTPGVNGNVDPPADTVVAGTINNAYTLVVSNTGPDPADNTVIRDPLPSGQTCTAVTCGSQTGGAVCPAVTVGALQSPAGVTIATLPANSSLTFILTCTVP